MEQTTKFVCLILFNALLLHEASSYYLKVDFFVNSAYLELPSEEGTLYYFVYNEKNRFEDIIGTERDIIATLSSAEDGSYAETRILNACFVNFTSPMDETEFYLSLQYDGPDQSPELDYNGLQLNALENGNSLHIAGYSITSSTLLTVNFYSPDETKCTGTVTIFPDGYNHNNYNLPFEDMVGQCDFTNIGAIEIQTNQQETNEFVLEEIALPAAYPPLPPGKLVIDSFQDTLDVEIYEVDEYGIWLASTDQLTDCPCIGGERIANVQTNTASAVITIGITDGELTGSVIGEAIFTQIETIYSNFTMDMREHGDHVFFRVASSNSGFCFILLYNYLQMWNVPGSEFNASESLLDYSIFVDFDLSPIDLGEITQIHFICHFTESISLGEISLDFGKDSPEFSSSDSGPDSPDAASQSSEGPRYWLFSLIGLVLPICCIFAIAVAIGVFALRRASKSRSIKDTIEVDLGELED